jgi:DNA modification methylase
LVILDGHHEEAPGRAGTAQARTGARQTKTEQAMKVQLRDISTITPYAQNPRVNSHAVDAVAASIREFGFMQPIVVDKDDVIIVGHTRYLAAIKLGLRKVPVLVALDLTPEQAKAYRIADNKTGELADWDDDRLAQELAELQGLDFDLDLLGFSEVELDKLLEGGNVAPGLVDPDEIPEPPDEAITKPGDLWRLGNHRLLCGDAGNADEVDRLLDGAAIHLVNTDPPYNVRVEPRSKNAIAAGFSSFEANPHQTGNGRRYPSKKKPTHDKLRARDRPLANDFVSDEEFDRLLHLWFDNLARVLLPGRSFLIWGGYANCGNYPPVLKATGLYFSQAIIWLKMHPVLTRKDLMGAHEWCFYGWREGAAHQFFGPANATDVWQIKKVNPQNMVHLTEKPTELAVRALQYWSRSGENVLDLFGGSGSTLIAAEQTGRRAFLLEIDPLYVDIIVQRWEKFTGRQAERERS